MWHEYDLQSWDGLAWAIDRFVSAVEFAAALVSTSTCRIRLDDPSRLAELQASERSVPGIDRWGERVSVRTRAILDVGDVGPDGRRPARLRDGRRARWIGVGLLFTGLGARYVLEATSADRARGAAGGTYVAVLCGVFAVLFLLYGFGVSRPTE